MLLPRGTLRRSGTREADYDRTASDDGTLSYDPGSIVSEENITEVWSRSDSAAAGKVLAVKHHVRFDCSHRRFKIITSVTSCAVGRTETRAHKKPFEAVPPGSLSEALYNEVCGTRG